MKITRQQINEIIIEELQTAVENGEITEQQLQELLPGLKALGKAAWGGIKKGAAKIRDIYRSGEQAAKGGPQQAQTQTDTPPPAAQQQTAQPAGQQATQPAGQQATQPAGQQATQPAGQSQAAAQQQAAPASAETPAAPKVISVEKGKNSLQNQLVSKYGGQLGPQANKALALISRNIKAELAANGIQVQESQKVIHGYLLKQFRLLMEGKLEDDYQEASSEESQAQAELKRLQQSVDPRDLFNYQGSTGLGGEAGYKKDLRQAQNAIDRAKEKKAELKKQIDTQAAQKPVEQPKAPEAAPTAAPAEQPAAKPTQTPTPPAAAKPTPEKAKHVPKAGQVNIARVVNDGLKQALGDLNDPKNQAVLKTLSPQIINLVTKFVNYAVNSSGKQGQVKIIGMGYGKQPAPAAAKPAAKPTAKPAAPAQQPAAPAAVAESYKATYDKWQKIIKG